METFFAAITRSFERTARLLWPVRRDVWLKLFFLCLFTGGGFHSGFRIPFSPKNATATVTAKSTQSHASAVADSIRAQWTRMKSIATNFWTDNRRLMLQAAALLAAILLIVLVMLLWVSARLQFVFLTSLLNEQVHIRKYWRETERLGESYFYFRLTIFVASVLIAILGIIMIANKIVSLSWPPHLSALTPLLIKAGALFAVGLPTLIFLYILERFLPVVMLVTNETILPALRRSLHFVGRHPLRAVGLVVGTILFSFALSVAMVMALVVIGIVVGGALAIGMFAVGLILKFAVHVGILGLTVVGVILAIGLGFIFMMAAVVPLGVVTGFLRLEVVKSQVDRKEN